LSPLLPFYKYINVSKFSVAAAVEKCIPKLKRDLNNTTKKYKRDKRNPQKETYQCEKQGQFMSQRLLGTRGDTERKKGH